MKTFSHVHMEIQCQVYIRNLLKITVTNKTESNYLIVSKHYKSAPMHEAILVPLA